MRYGLPKLGVVLTFDGSMSKIDTEVFQYKIDLFAQRNNKISRLSKDLFFVDSLFYLYVDS